VGLEGWPSCRILQGHLKDSEVLRDLPERYPRLTGHPNHIVMTLPRIWLHRADIDEGNKPGMTPGQFAKLREANKRIRLLEQANEVGQSLRYTSVIGDLQSAAVS